MTEGRDVFSGLRAAARRDPSRGSDRGWWTVQAVKQVGFPIVIAMLLMATVWALLFRLPDKIESVLTANARVQEVQSNALADRIGAETKALEVQTQALRQHMEETSRVNSVILDRADTMVRRGAKPVTVIVEQHASGPASAPRIEHGPPPPVVVPPPHADPRRPATTKDFPRARGGP